MASTSVTLINQCRSICCDTSVGGRPAGLERDSDTLLVSNDKTDTLCQAGSCAEFQHPTYAVDPTVI